MTLYLKNLWSSEDPVPVQWMEFFAGQAEATKMFKMTGHTTARLDINYMQPMGGKMNPMDLLTDAGFARLDKH